MSALHSVSGTADTAQKDADNLRATGAFVRGVSAVRSWIGTKEFPAEPNRYHLYVAFNCPWCHRVVLARELLGLGVSISMDVAFPTRTSEKDAKGRDGLWTFRPDGMVAPNGQDVKFPECTADSIFGFSTVVEIYDKFEIPQKSLPLLIDKQTMKLVNNESAELLRMFGLYASALGGTRVIDLYPEAYRAEIDQVNDWVYHEINNGSYKAGFTTNQAHYEDACRTYFAALGKCDQLLANHKFLVSDNVTEADVRLFPTLFRHDPVYYNRFKLNLALLKAYPNVLRWMRTMYTEVPGVRSSSGVSYLQHCKQGYYGRSGSNTIPLGPPGYPDCYWN